MKAKVGSNKLFLSLENFNNSLLNDIKNREYTAEMEQEERIANENALLYQSLKLFNFVGLTDPLRKIYITTKTPENLPLVLTLLLMNELGAIDFDHKLNSLVKRTKEKNYELEPNFLIIGIIGFLNQFHQSHTDIFISYLGHYVKATVNFLLLTREIQKNPEQIGDFFALLYVIEEVFRYKEENYEVWHYYPIR